MPTCYNAMRLISLIGIAVFSFLFYSVYSHPEMIEKMARSFVITKATLKIDDLQQSYKVSSISSKALSIAGKLGLDQQSIRENVDAGIDNYIRDSLNSICKFDCPEIEEKHDAPRFANFKFHGKSVFEALKERYMKTIGLLVRDLQIFAGVNAATFLVLFGMTFIRTCQPKALIAPWCLLLMSVIIACISYLGNSHWFYDILMNKFMGFGYLFSIVFIYWMLADIAFNDAKGFQAVFYLMMGMAVMSSFS